ncbi:MAG: metal dependent phosphohydrolase [Anaerocolumna sp.]|jgi:3'-5' exoribonuclease|nr:metal dependent phosphohydrolase [Anaerocolumna sp.]
MRYINELRDGEMVSETYLCKQKQSQKTKAGKNYYSLLLQDKSGTLDAKIWELSQGIDHFESMEYIRVDGQIVSFQGTLQLNVKRVRRSQEGEYDPSDFVPTSTKNINTMFSELINFISGITDINLRKLTESFFVEDKKFADNFKKHSAAKSVHHGFSGGLLEHTLGVVKLCDYYADNYPLINRDLLITAALFHDVGKMEELSAFPENDYTDDGQLLGHIYIGTEIIGARIRTLPNFPPQLASQLKHCILAHHGELEYGSPKKPAIIEALALNFADNTDAKLQTMTEILNGGEEKATWLGLNRLFETNIRRTSF